MALLAIIVFTGGVLVALVLTVHEEVKYRRRRKLDLKHRSEQEQTRRAQQRQRLQKAS